MTKSAILAYVLWVFGGLIGLHLVYLGRYRHALVHACTSGGFGLLWFWDLFIIPDYVEEANMDPVYAREQRVIRERPPRFGVVRYCCEILFSAMLAITVTLCFNNISREVFLLLQVFTPLIVAIGAHTVACVGQERGSFKVACTGAYLGAAVYLFDPFSTLMPAFAASTAMAVRGKSWKWTSPEDQPVQSKHQSIMCLVLVVLCATAYGLMWAKIVIYEAKIKVDGEEMPAKDFLYELYQSREFQSYKGAFWEFLSGSEGENWSESWSKFIKKIDPDGEEWAREVLNVSPDASEEEIALAYRKLVREWHPDKVTDPSKREEATEKFVAIQKAYDRLSKKQSQRARKRKKSPRTFEDYD